MKNKYSVPERLCSSICWNLLHKFFVLGYIMNFYSFAGFQRHIVGEDLQLSHVDHSDSDLLQSNFEEMAVIGLDAMQRANSTLEDFVSSSLFLEERICYN